MAETKTKKAKDKKKKKAAQRKETVRYARLQFEGCTHETRAPDPKDKWDSGETSTHWGIPSHFTVGRKAGFYAEPLTFDPLPGQVYFMVYAIWSTGDSFGHYANSNCECFGIYQTNKEAEDRKAELSKPKIDGKYESYRPWHGYFESLDSLEIKSIICNGLCPFDFSSKI